MLEKAAFKSAVGLGVIVNEVWLVMLKLASLVQGFKAWNRLNTSVRFFFNFLGLREDCTKSSIMTISKVNRGDS